MRSIALPETHAPRLHIECVCSDGGSYCIQTKRCSSVKVPNDVVNVFVTPLDEAMLVSAPAVHLRIQQRVGFTVE